MRLLLLDLDPREGFKYYGLLIIYQRINYIKLYLLLTFRVFTCAGYYPKFISDRLSTVPGLLPVRVEDLGLKASLVSSRSETYLQPMRYGIIPSGWDGAEEDHQYERYGLLTPVTYF